VIFLCLLTVLNTLSTVIDDTIPFSCEIVALRKFFAVKKIPGELRFRSYIPFGSRKRQNFQDIKNFQKYSNKKF
jgi:hypothetical protein